MNDKKTFIWKFELSEQKEYVWGMDCPDCVNEGNVKIWNSFLLNKISELLCADSMQTEDYQEALRAVCKEEEERLVRERRLARVEEVRQRRRCMVRTKIDFVPKGLTVDLEAAYANYIQQVVTFMPEDKDDFLYMLRLLERWEKKSIPAVLAKGRPDAAYAIAIGLCRHVESFLMRNDISEYLTVYRLRIGRFVYACFAALVNSVFAWHNEEKRVYVFNFINSHLSRYDGLKWVQNKIRVLAPNDKIVGEPVRIVREMNDDEARAAREVERLSEEKKRLLLEAEKEAKSLIPLNRDFEERIFNYKNIDEDCSKIASLMWNEKAVIDGFIADGNYQEAALKFLQLTKSMCRHFMMDCHWDFYDDLYSPEYVVDSIVDVFENLVKQGKLPENVKTYIHEAWKEIKDMECCTDYCLLYKVGSVDSELFS